MTNRMKQVSLNFFDEKHLEGKPDLPPDFIKKDRKERVLKWAQGGTGPIPSAKTKKVKTKQY